jgi:hypothetical protein
MDFILEYVSYIVVAVIAYWIGWHIRAILFIHNISKNPDGMIAILNELKKAMADDEQQADIPEGVIEMKIETVGDMVYAYDKVTGQFLAQAQDIYQAAVVAASRFPGKKFYHPDLKEVARNS